ncbi:hypothetical protein CFC21_106234 [Triticum aestivum]|uniref:HECT-type E3 ubiquitin transferase n=2 Tax=Triticum aestivum TaxID=4565 RepID=A0A9R1N992_WHEAT|nr:hypothetical protein CFC21_106234 [Triticum aestivum]
MYHRHAKRHRDSPDEALPTPKQPLTTTTTHSFASSSSPGVHFFVRATDSKTIVMHTARAHTVAVVLDNFVDCGYGPDLHLLYAGRRLQPEATIASLGLLPDSTLHLNNGITDTPHHFMAWQVASRIAKATTSSIEILDMQVMEYIAFFDPRCQRNRHHRAEDYIQIFLESGAAITLVDLYLSDVSLSHTQAERAIRCFLSMDPASLPSTVTLMTGSDPASLPPSVMFATVPVLLEFCRLLSSAAGNGDSLYKSCRYTLASILCLPFSMLTSTKSPTRVRVLPFAREVVELVLNGLASESMMVSRTDLEELSNFFKVLCPVMPDGLMPNNIYNISHKRGDTWIWELHEMSMNLLKILDECLWRLEMNLPSSSSESRGFIESQPIWANRLHILAVLEELNFISSKFEDVAHSLRFVLLVHKAPLNALVRCSKRNEHLHWLVKHKDLLCFEARRNFVLMLFPEGEEDYGVPHEMLIDRSRLLDDELHSGLFIEFKNEKATGRGVLREWFCMVSQALFSPQQVLFLPCPNDQRRFYLNGTSAMDPLHLEYFIFSGRLIGLALMHKVQVGIVLDRTLFLHLAGRSITLEDIATADPITYASYVHILGTQRNVDICAGGQDISVNISNIDYYIDLLIKNIFVDSISNQLAKFAKGFSDILANPELKKVFFGCLDQEDFDRMLGGNNNSINLKDWGSHTQYNGYKEKDRHVNWFWKAVESMPVEQQRQLLFFWTSVKYLPSEGFGGLSSKLYIHNTFESADHLPSSHTCFYHLGLPPYPTLKVMHNQLQKITQEHVSCSFGTG